MKMRIADQVRTAVGRLDLYCRTVPRSHHQPNHRAILGRLAEPTAVTEIRECFFE
jgi:hypothetical protein